MFYTVYKTTNLVNGKVYIGKHQTEEPNDDYFGSGKMLKRAIEKYGAENFQKEVLFIFDNEDDMNDKEEELVTEEFCSLDTNYNLCSGGNGGFGYINNNLSKHERNWKPLIDYWSLNGRKTGRSNFKKAHIDGKIPYDNFKGKRHTEETKRQIGKVNSERQRGLKNSQFGTMWITNGTENKKIKNVDSIPKGWYRGRK